jgi:DNA replication protein DnaC
MSRPDGEAAGLRDQIIRQNCRTLKTPAIAAQYQRLAEAAAREGHSHVRYLDALLGAEIEERERKAVLRRVKEARLPRLKTLQEFDFAQSRVSAARVADLAAGGYIARAEPVLLLGEAGTGKTHLASGLCVAACEQRRRVRFTTATALVNELVEARAANALSRALGRWERVELICIDELGYVPLAELGAELLFQVIADRAERAAAIVTSNLPFSEWGQVFCKRRLSGTLRLS